MRKLILSAVVALGLTLPASGAQAQGYSNYVPGMSWSYYAPTYTYTPYYYAMPGYPNVYWSTPYWSPNYRYYSWYRAPANQP